MSTLTAYHIALLRIMDRLGSCGIVDIMDTDDVDPIVDNAPSSVRALLMQLSNSGHVEPDKTVKPVQYKLTMLGQRALLPNTNTGSIAAPRQCLPAGDYDGRELRPFTGRPGAMDAFTKPSVHAGHVVERRAPVSMACTTIKRRPR